MWGSKVFFNSFSRNARGLAVLIKDNANVDNLMWENIIPGSYSNLSLTACNERILLKCIYALNEDSRPEETEHESTRFFKTVFNDDSVNNPHSREIMKRKRNLCSLVDIW